MINWIRFCNGLMALSHRGALGDANPKVGLNAKSEQLLILNVMPIFAFSASFRANPVITIAFAAALEGIPFSSFDEFKKRCSTAKKIN